MNIIYIVKENNISINTILKRDLKISSRLQTHLIKNKLVFCNNSFLDTRNVVNIGDCIKVDLSYKEDNSNIVPQKMDLNILYEDDSFLIINKPSCIATHPSILHFNDTLSNGLKYYFDTINLQKKIRPVNRLDFHTSGLIVFAKNEYVQECLISQMKTNLFKKEYIALVSGIIQENSGIINLPISRKNGSIIERCISESGKISITKFEVLQRFKRCTLVKCSLLTGRTHQIRIHFAAISHPLIGDTLYGTRSDFIDGQALHCFKLSFFHPIKNVHVKVLTNCRNIFDNLIRKVEE